MMKEHKNRNAVADAWKRIRNNVGMTCTTLALKRKRKSLMSTYRLYRKKYQDSFRSGASASEIFRSSWFAYELIYSLLAAVYNTINTEANELNSLF
nr:unnamed protein product [Callosobruchus analis]